VLCDRVAILKKGRLANVGYLNELRQQVAGQNLVEIVVSGSDEAALKTYLPPGNDFQITSIPGGVRVELKDESDVDSVLAALRKCGGKLLTVQPVRQSLEELFVDRK